VAGRSPAASRDMGGRHANCVLPAGLRLARAGDPSSGGDKDEITPPVERGVTSLNRIRPSTHLAARVHRSTALAGLIIFSHADPRREGYCVKLAGSVMVPRYRRASLGLTAMYLFELVASGVQIKSGQGIWPEQGFS